MTSWDDFEKAAPDLGRAVRERFEAYGLGLIATLRKDGSPRISGIEPFVTLGDLWLGMMPDSRKALDLVRDPRFALHAATVDKEVKQGDAKLSGRADLVEDDELKRDVMTAFREKNGYAPEGIDFPLFRADITDVSTVRPDGDHLVIESWRPGEAVRRVERS